MVSSRNIKQRGSTVIDPRFVIPPGIIDLSHKVEDVTGDPDDTLLEDSDTPNDDTSIQIVDIGGNTIDPVDGPPAPTYLPPTTITIISQTVRILADGSHVVDVLFDIPEDLGVNEFDVRLSKL